MLDKLLKQEQTALNYFFEKLDTTQLQQAVETMASISGTIHITGVGKSGIIAKKMATTLLSTGTRSHVLSPLDALHGDIAQVQPGDLVLLLSKSGETEELIELIPYIHERGATTMAWTCRANSTLETTADTFLTLPLLKELCPFDLAPTTSALLQLLVGDVLAMALVEKKNFTLEAYNKNHPSGTIGRKMRYRVSDLMLNKTEAPCIPKAATLKDATLKLTETRKGCVLIVDENNILLGIFTDGDLKRVLTKEIPLSSPIESHMTTSYKAIREEALAWEALKEMQHTEGNWITEMPVTKDGLLIGLLRMHDIVRKGIR